MENQSNNKISALSCVFACFVWSLVFGLLVWAQIELSAYADKVDSSKLLLLVSIFGSLSFWIIMFAATIAEVIEDEDKEITECEEPDAE